MLECINTATSNILEWEHFEINASQKLYVHLS